MEVNIGPHRGEVYRTLTTPRADSDADRTALGAHTSGGGAFIDRFEGSPELNMRLSQDILMSATAKKLEAMFAEHGLELEDYGGVDMAPEATAERIFGFASGMIEIYRKQNSTLSDEKLVDQFEETIRGAVKLGYEEAAEILEGMGIWDGAKENAERTMSLVDKKFDNFFATLRGSKEESPVHDDPGNAEVDTLTASERGWTQVG